MSLPEASIESKFNELRSAIDREATRELPSQGGNAIIITYPPEDEKEYLEKAKKELHQVHLINIADLFVEMINKIGIDDFKEAFKNFRDTPSALFNNPMSEHQDLFELIMDEVKKAFEKDKIPALVRTGMLYGTDIENLSFIEDDLIRRANKPLIIFYPATVRERGDEKDIFFLGLRKASSYRGVFIF